MRKVCEQCGTVYEDSSNWTICPHEPLKPRLMMDDWNLGNKLLGKRVRFAHLEPGVKDMTVNTLRFDGMVGTDELPGFFAPHVFVLLEDAHV